MDTFDWRPPKRSFWNGKKNRWRARVTDNRCKQAGAFIHDFFFHFTLTLEPCHLCYFKILSACILFCWVCSYSQGVSVSLAKLPVACENILFVPYTLTNFHCIRTSPAMSFLHFGVCLWCHLLHLTNVLAWSEEQMKQAVTKKDSEQFCQNNFLLYRRN